MTQHTFQRYEKKYLLSAQQYRLLRSATEELLLPDQFGKSTILSVYYDTPDFRLIRASMDKPAYKEKLRLRSYGVPGAEDTVFVELKKKYRGVVYKRREALPLDQAEAWLARGEDPRHSQISREITYALDYYPGLAPAMFICYDRIALYGAADPQLRVTFDSRILYRREALALERGAWGEPLLQPGQRLMEVKLQDAMPLWLADLLDALRIYPTTFSKYGTAYTRALTRQAQGGEQSA